MVGDKVKGGLWLAWAVCLVLMPLEIQAEEKEETFPEAFHAPPATWKAGKVMNLRATLTEDWKLEQLWVLFRPLGSEGEYERFPLDRAPDNTFLAIIPGEKIQPPGLEYYLTSEDTKGGQRLHFSGPERPHRVLVHGETNETRRRDRLVRHQGHTDVFRFTADASLYGRRLVGRDDLFFVGDGGPLLAEAFSDRFWTLELEYIHRTLSYLYDFRFGIGVMRGERSEVVLEDGRRQEVGVEGSADAPGMNWGWAEFTFELHRNFSVAPRVMLGATERGFAAGGGGLIRIGRIEGTRLEFYGEGMNDVGARGGMRFAWDTVPSVPMSLEVEVSNWPDSDTNPLANRLIYQIGLKHNTHFTTTLRIGYGQRQGSVEGGVLGGVGTSFEF